MSTPPRPPGRPREFDVDDVVRSAMEVFWDRGYAGASLEDLIDGTGLSRGSIYKAFGDKEGLFLAALDAYINANVSAMRDCLAGGSVAAIRAALLAAGRLALGPGRRGCWPTRWRSNSA